MLSEEDKKRIIEKYKKILALTTSPVEGERQAALHMAEEYRKKFNIQEKKQRNTEGYWDYSSVYWYDEYGRKQYLWKEWVQPKYNDYFTQKGSAQKFTRDYEKEYYGDYLKAMEFLKESGIGLDDDY